MLLSERGLGGSDADLELRLRRWRGEQGQARRGGARAWRRRLADASLAAPAKGGQGRESAPASLWPFPTASPSAATPSGADWISVGGRGFRLDPASPLAREDWLAVAEVGGVGGRRAHPRRRADRPGDGRERCSPTGSRAAPRSPSIPPPARVRAPPRPPARRDPALGRPGQPRRPGGDRGGAARRRARATASRCCRGARPRGRCAAAPPSPAATIPSIPDLSDAALLADARRLAAAAARRQAAARRRRSALRMLDACSAGRARKAVDRLAPSHFETPAGSRHRDRL